MPFIPKTILPKRGLAFVALLLAAPMALGALGFVRGGTGRPVISRTATSDPAVSSTMTLQSNSTRLDAEHVTLRSTGFEPAEFTRAAGRFLLSIDNRAEKGEMTFQLLRENGVRERDLPLKQDKFRLRQVIELHPGHYSLVVTNHPEWVCRITIQ
jgi:hypothetical protein